MDGTGAEVAAMNEVLTVEEVADLLKVHRTTVYRMLKSGELPAFKIGSDWRFNRVRIEEWLKSRTQPPED
jgi:excisionase family DNA binding protein